MLVLEPFVISISPYSAQETVQQDSKMLLVHINGQAQGRAGGYTLLVVELSDDVGFFFSHDIV